MHHDTGSPRIHLPTVLAVSTIAWCSFAVLHEIVGHGGAAALLGERVLGVLSTTVHIENFYDLDGVSRRIGWWGFRTVAAAGTFVNLFTAGLSLAILKVNSKLPATARYYLWLFATISIFQQAFWLALMPFVGLGGDWTAFFLELEDAWIWKSAVTLTGIGLLWAGIYIPFTLWSPQWGNDETVRKSLFRKLILLPLLYLFVLQLLSVVWSPLEGPRHTTIVSVFSFIPFILVLPIVRFVLVARIPRSAETITIASDTAWKIAGLIVALVYVGILGAGIGTFSGHPDFSR